MKSTPAARLDQQTPRWPEIRADLSAGTVTVGQVTRPLTTEDHQHELVAIATERASALGNPIRLTVDTQGQLDRLIVTPEGAAVLLETVHTPDGTSAEHPPSIPAEGHDRGATGRLPQSKSTKKPRQRTEKPRKSGGFFSFLSAQQTRRLKIVGIAATAVLLASIVAIVIAKNRGADSGTEASAAPPSVTVIPTPPAARLYTLTPPPGWSQQAWWALPIAEGSIPATDEASGLTALVSATDNTKTAPTINPDGDPAQHNPNYLTVVDAAGSAKWATKLEDEPKVGPLITTIDGTRSVLIGDRSSITYWPLATGRKPVTVDFPDGARSTLNTVGESLALTLPDDRYGIIRGGTVQILQGLPRTELAFALDGSLVLIERETGTWWNLTGTGQPKATKPAAPAAGYTVNKILAATPSVVVIAWRPSDTSAARNTVTVVAYNRATGAKLASITAKPAAIKAGRTVASSDTSRVTAIGNLVFTNRPDKPALQLFDGFTATTVQDATYGSTAGNTAARITIGAPTSTPLAASTAVPVGITARRLMVTSQDVLYALRPSDQPTVLTTTATATPAPVTVTAPARTVTVPKTLTLPPKTVTPAPRTVVSTVTAAPSS